MSSLHHVGEDLRQFVVGTGTTVGALTLDLFKGLGMSALAGARDGWRETMRRTFEGRGFYACTGAAVDAVEDAVEVVSE